MGVERGDPRSDPDLLTELEDERDDLEAHADELLEQVETMALQAAVRDGELYRYRQLFDFALDPYLITTPEGTILSANVAVCELLGVWSDDLPGKPLAALVARAELGVFFHLLGRLEGSARLEQELALRCGDDGGIRVVLSGALTVDRHCIHWTMRRVRPSAAPDAMGERQRRLEAEAAGRAKDQFLAVLAHDMKSPVMTIQGWVDKLRHGGLAPEVHDLALATIEHSARAQAALVDELFDLTRLGVQKLSLQLGRVDLCEAAQACVDAARPTAQRARVELVLERVTERAPIIADAARMDRVLGNLIANAVKFTPPGGLVRVRVEELPDRVELRVVDDGCGISAADLPRIFECFAQSDTAQQSGAGLGLGLYIARQIVDLHQGSLIAHSEGSDRGSTFVLTLPPQRRGRAVFPARTEGQLRLLQDLRVLVVEDDIDERAALVALLEGHGARIESARDVDAARRAFDAFAPQVLLSDIGLGSSTGYELVRWVRAERHSAIPAVALTGYAGRDEEARVRRAGFDLYFKKPVDPQRLVQALGAAVAVPA